MAVGRSKITPYKQECLKDIARENIHKCQCVWNKHEFSEDKRVYYLFDTTAGDGNLKENSSPKIFLELLYEKQGLNFRFYLNEKTKKTFNRLEINLNTWITYSIDEKHEVDYFLTNTHALYGDFKEKLKFFDRVKKWKMGMIYFDPNGIGSMDDWDFIAKTSYKWPHLDLLINISLTTLKRCFCSTHPNHSRFSKNLSELLDPINKTIWWVREIPKNQQRWTMLFGTNMPNYSLDRLDFIRLDSEKGRDFLNGIDKFISNDEE